MEYEKLQGFNVKPKDSLLIEDMINVNEMIVINPGLIEKLVSKKCKRRLEKIILMLSVVYGDEASDDGAIEMVLDEMEKYKTMLRKKYKDYLKKEEYKLYLKKIEILESEARIRINEKRREIQEERGRRGR